MTFIQCVLLFALSTLVLVVQMAASELPLGLYHGSKSKYPMTSYLSAVVHEDRTIDVRLDYTLALLTPTPQTLLKVFNVSFRLEDANVVLDRAPLDVAVEEANAVLDGSLSFLDYKTVSDKISISFNMESSYVRVIVKSIENEVMLNIRADHRVIAQVPDLKVTSPLDIDEEL